MAAHYVADIPRMPPGSHKALEGVCMALRCNTRSYRSIFSPSTRQEQDQNFDRYWHFCQAHGGEKIMTLQSNKRDSVSSPQDRPLTPVERMLARWSAMSPRKRTILEERCRGLWETLDENVRGQTYPAQAKDHKPLTPKNIETRNVKSSPFDLAHIDLLTGVECEKFIGQAFEQKGYTVEYHGGPTEAGGELVCWERSAHRTHTILVQVKRARSLTGTKAISQILRKENWFRHTYPDASYEKWVITSSDFSRQAKVEAEIGGIILVRRATLEAWIGLKSV